MTANGRYRVLHPKYKPGSPSELVMLANAIRMHLEHIAVELAHLNDHACQR